MTLGPYSLDRVHQGYVPLALRALPSESVHCVITSPPYWGLRKYDGVKPQTWADGSTEFLGLEDSAEAYVDHIVECFRAVRRVLRRDGTLWLNMGDCYCAAPKGNSGYGTSNLTNDGKCQAEKPLPRRGKSSNLGNPSSDFRPAPHRAAGSRLRSRSSFRRDRAACMNVQHKGIQGLKPKDLAGMPWRVAFALQADGWYLRQDIIWHKPNSMPESVGDRTTRSHEYIFLFSRSERYFYDAFAIREPASQNTHTRGKGVNPKARIPSGWDQEQGPHDPMHKASRDAERAFNGKRARAPRVRQNEDYSSAVSGIFAYRNRRSVWRVPTSPCKAAHFAAFPPRLVEPMIRAGTSEHGVCQACGTPYFRVVDELRDGIVRDQVTVDWEPGCSCTLFSGLKPAVVLDPFAGSGTVIGVALGLGRRSLGFEASESYINDICPDRIRKIQSQIKRMAQK